MLANDRDGLGGGDVVARCPVFLAWGYVEVLLDQLLPPRQPIASAHGEIMADRTETNQSQAVKLTILSMTSMREQQSRHE